MSYLSVGEFQKFLLNNTTSTASAEAYSVVLGLQQKLGTKFTIVATLVCLLLLILRYV